MPASFHIAHLVLLDRDRDEIARRVRAVRGDLAIHTAPPPAGIEGSVALATFAPPDTINALPNLAWIHCTGAGLDKLFAQLTREVPVITRTVGGMGRQMAEYVLGYLLAEAQGMTRRAALQAERRWDGRAAAPSFLHGRTGVVFGTGEMGRSVAERLDQFGVRSVGVSRRGRAVAPFAACYTPETLPDAELAQADFVVAALPDAPGTAGLIGRGVFSRLSGAHFLNVGRGTVAREADILAALDTGRLRAATLDVFAAEPLAAASPLWAHPRVAVTPHVSGVTQPGDAADAFLAALSALEAGQTPPNLVEERPAALRGSS